eukprot:5521269-Pyramimonas_sp.AAC.1
MLSKVVRDSGSGCNICLRSWGTPNPNLKKRDTQPSLQRRSERSLVCSPCTQNVYDNCPAETMKSIEQKLKLNEITQE